MHRTSVAAALVALLLAAAPAAARAPVRGAKAVPILMYHVIAAPPPGAAYPGLYVPRSVFAAQTAALAAHGYRAITLRRLFGAWHGHGVLPPRPIVLTFDDGYRSDYTNALPVLRARGWPGVLDLVLANMRPVWGLPPRLVRALIAAGWEIDSHTLTHADLTRVDPQRLALEVAGSRRALRRKFGVPVDFFCYPAGRYNAAVVAEVAAAGYLGATTTRYGLAEPNEPYTLRRFRVGSAEGSGGLLAALQALQLR
jgi:peptidoglycan/xylan/chitin deacetylase (PgdA/CDA1 family)